MSQQPPRRLTRKELLRKNKKIAKRRQNRMILAGIVVTAFLVYITGIYGTSLAYLGDFLSSGLVYMQFGNGFPFQVENQTFKQSEKMGASLCVLDSDSLSFWSPTGSKVFEYYHSMQNPIIDTSDKRVVIYNANETSLKVANAHKILFNQEMENDIIHASLSKNNYVAVTTKSQSYNGEVKVYDSQMKEVITWLNAKSFPLQSYLSPKAKNLVVSCLQTENGRLDSHVYVIDVNKGTENFVIKNTGAAVLGIEYIKENEIVIFYTNKAILVNAEDGSTKEEYVYSDGNLKSYDIKNGQIIMSFSGYSAVADSTIVVTDLNFKENFKIDTSQAISDVIISGQRIYALGRKSVEQYTLKGEKIAETPVKNNIKDILDYNGCIAIYGDSLDKIEKYREDS